jgi:hypothetical protein
MVPELDRYLTSEITYSYLSKKEGADFPSVIIPFR